jgi:uncharacterized protein (TIGR02246 family)
MTESSRLDELEAYERIRRLTADYSHGIDKRDRERFAAIWAETAEWEPQPGMPWCRGREAILEMLDQIWSFVAETHHWVCNHAIDVDGDSATGLSDATAVALSPDGKWTRTAASYNDVYHRVDGRWQIVRRTCQVHHALPIAEPQLQP